MDASRYLITILFVVCSCGGEDPEQLALGTYHLCYRDGGDVSCRMIDDVPATGQTQVPDDVAFVEIVSGWKWSCGLDERGTPHCWGDEHATGIVETMPDERFVKLGANVSSPCGIRQDGTVSCWGPDWEGETADHEGEYISIDGPTGMFCGMTPDHTIDCWGWDEPERPPADIPFSSFDMSSHAGCALDWEGMPTCWGDDSYGQVGVPTGVLFSQIAMGGQHGCGLTLTGEALCWGSNRFGQLDALSGPYKQLASGMRATCGIRETGDVVCWGCINDSFCNSE